MGREARFGHDDRRHHLAAHVGAVGVAGGEDRAAGGGTGDEDDELRVENNRPFEMLLDPEINANALTWAENADKARTTTNDSVGKGSSLVRRVDLRGFEPLTSSMRTRRATNCATGP